MRGHLMNPMIPNLHGSKMSSSHPPETKIMFLDDGDAVRGKILEAPWHGLDATTNGVLSLLKNVLFPVVQLQLEQQKALDGSEVNGVGPAKNIALKGSSAVKSGAFIVEVDGKCRTFSSYSDLARSLADGDIKPDAIKAAVAKGINDLLDHVRKMYNNDPEWQAIDKSAYPTTS